MFLIDAQPDMLEPCNLPNEVSVDQVSMER